MKSIAELLVPKESVFNDATRDDVLNLTDFAEGSIDASKFFDENFITSGMEILFNTAFERFKGESDTGVIKLTQAMGGGKTHSMLALALLAKHTELRESILKKRFHNIGDIKVVTFSGREDAPYGIWGCIAEQLGKLEMFNQYYSPLKAPGESAWVELLKGEKTLILLDELPPYLENAKSIPIGKSDLSKVTTTALANLFSALGKAQLANVCLVFSDLKATYESGSELLQESFKELEAEANRIAIEITPVALNNDEIYSILKTRLFQKVEGDEYEQAVNDIAREYKDCVDRCRKRDYTSYSPDSVFKGIKDSYPFHPSIKDLYARFKENQNFQQTRGLIKLMRQIVRQFFETGLAEKRYLINVFDFDLNEHRLLNQIIKVKSSLNEAIAHDIAQNGRAIAEIIDDELGSKKTITTDIANLIFVASLSDTTNGLLGLSEPEIYGYLSAPGVDMDKVKNSLDELIARCWYLKEDRQGKLYFQNTKNLIAELHSLVDSYTNENARKKLREILEKNFSPTKKDCYQKLYVLPAIDEMDLDVNKISLIIHEPEASHGLHPELKDFHENTQLKNRVMYLSGPKSMSNRLYADAKKLQAIEQIIKNLKLENVSQSDPQYKEADNQQTKIELALLSVIEQAFVQLYFPNKNGITPAEFKLNESQYTGEEQVKKCLIENNKYEELITGGKKLDTLRKKCEKRLFKSKEMSFSEIKNRAATTVEWQWYPPEQLDTLKSKCIEMDEWREIDGYIVKGPFEKDPTSVTVTQSSYNEETREFCLKVRGVGGKVYWDVDVVSTEKSEVVQDEIFKTVEPKVNFVCIDETNERRTGDVVKFIGKVPLKHEQRENADGHFLELQIHPQYVIKYTTDGSNPKEYGEIYSSEIQLPKNSRSVLIAIYLDDEFIEDKKIDVQISGEDISNDIDKTKPLQYKYSKKKVFDDTADSFKELKLLGSIGGVSIQEVSVYLYSKDDDSIYTEISSSSTLYKIEDLDKFIDFVRSMSFPDTSTGVSLSYKELHFASGELFFKWVKSAKLDLGNLRKEGEIKQ